MHTVEYKKRFHLYSTTQVRKYPSELQVNLLCCHGVKSVAVVLWTLQKIVTKCSSGWRVNKDELKVLGWPKSLDSSIYVSKTQNEIFGQPNSCMTSEIHHGYTVQLKVMLSFSVIFKLFFYLWIHDIIQFDDTRHFFPLMTSFLRVGTGSWLST